MSLGCCSDDKAEDRGRYLSLSTAPWYNLFRHCGSCISCQPPGESLSLGSLQEVPPCSSLTFRKPVLCLPGWLFLPDGPLDAPKCIFRGKAGTFAALGLFSFKRFNGLLFGRLPNQQPRLTTGEGQDKKSDSRGNVTGLCGSFVFPSSTKSRPVWGHAQGQLHTEGSRRGHSFQLKVQ